MNRIRSSYSVILVTLLLLMPCLLPCSSYAQSEEGYESFELDNFEGITLLDELNIELHLRQGDHYVVEASCGKPEVFKAIGVRVRGGNLVISCDNKRAAKISQKLEGKNRLRFNVTMPSIQRIDVGAMVNIIVETPINGDELKLDMSGASSISFRQKMQLKDLNLDVSGICNISFSDLTVSNNLTSDLSGMTQLTFQKTKVGGDCHIDLSGKGNLSLSDLTVVGRTTFDLSGYGKTVIARLKADSKAVVSLSGYGSIHIKDLIHNGFDINASGFGQVVINKINSDDNVAIEKRSFSSVRINWND